MVYSSRPKVTIVAGSWARECDGLLDFHPVTFLQDTIPYLGKYIDTVIR